AGMSEARDARLSPLDEHVEDQLAAYTAGELSALEHAHVVRHLEGCAGCQSALGEAERIRVLLGLLADPAGHAETPSTVADAVLARLPEISWRASTSVEAATSSDATQVKEVTPQGPACPISAVERVPSGDLPVDLPVDLRRGPLYKSGRRRLRWTRPAGTIGRDGVMMERETVHISGRRQNVSPVAGEGAPGPGRPWRGDAASGGRERT